MATTATKKDPVALRQYAEAAEQLKDNPMVQAAFDEMERTYTSWITDSQPDDTAVREQAYYMLQAVKKLRAQIQAFVTDKKFRDEHFRKNTTGK